MGQGSSEPQRNLSPLALRLCDALETIANDTPQLAFISAAMRKQMSRSPIGDDEIMASLVWVQEMLHAIIVGPTVTAPPSVNDWPMALPLTPEEIAVLDSLSDARELSSATYDAFLAGPNGDDVIEGTQERQDYYNDAPLPPVAPADTEPMDDLAAGWKNLVDDDGGTSV
jgi:hypothetical protein